MNTKSNSNSRKRDFLLFFVLIFISLLILFARRHLLPQNGVRVLVFQDGALLHEYALHENRTETIPAPHGGSNTLHIENGFVYVTDATCPDKICEHSGKISLPGEIIACLPNLLLIQISE